MTKQPQNPGIYFSLVSQLDKLARHNRQASFRTKERYYLVRPSYDFPQDQTYLRRRDVPGADSKRYD